MLKSSISGLFRQLAFLTFPLLSVPLYAGAGAAAGKEALTPAAAKEAGASAFDKLWGLATLYKNDKNPFMQELKLRGRYHGQYHWLDSDQGDDNGWEDRRSRLGIDAKFFRKHLELRFDVQSSDDFDPFYNGIVDAYLTWKPVDDFSLTVGRQKPQIGYYDFLQSTTNQPTFERSQIYNQLRVDRAVGAVAEGIAGDLTWQAGVYSNDIDEEFGQFDAGISFGAGLGYDLKGALDLEKADIRFDWLHNEIEPGSTVLNRYGDLFSATFWLKERRASLVVESFAGTGSTTGDVWGFFVQPAYDLVPKKLQLVGRYTFSDGSGPDSVFAQSRYERNAPELTGGGRGDQYQAVYGGLQYFIHGDKLKLMAGAEYADVSGGGNGGDYSGWTILSGVRIAF